MGKLPRYNCTGCGQGFTSARSGRRHVANVESGNASVVTEADYRIGILTGTIPPPIPKFSRPLVKRRRQDHPLNIAAEEFWRGYWNRMGGDTWSKYGSQVEFLPIIKILLDTLESKQEKDDKFDLKKFFSLFQ